MTETDTNTSENRSEVVEAGDDTAVQIEEYPGGDMTIYKSGGESLYLTSGQASALRSALGRIDGAKGGTEDAE